MNILTVVCDIDSNWNRMAKIWLYFVKKNCPQANIYAGDIGMSDDLKNYFKKHRVTILSKKPEFELLGKPEWRQKTNYKTQFLCDFPKPVIITDIDAMILKDLTPLWELRQEKPLIAVHFDNDASKPFNSGVMLLGEPDFLQWPKIKAFADNIGWDFCDQEQKLLYAYCKSLGYSPKHESIGPYFNAWALDMKWTKKGKQIICSVDAYIAHFVGPLKGKPWQLKIAKTFWFHRFPGIQRPQTKIDKLFEIARTKDLQRLILFIKYKFSKKDKK